MEGRTSDWRPGPTVCRCCLTEGCYKDISTEYFWMGKREVYAEMLSETLNLSIAYSKSGGPNSNSRLICEPCIARLRDASEFKRQVIDCEKTFMNHLDPGSSSKSRDLTADPVPEVKVEMVKREKESFSDDDFDDRPDFLDVDSDDDLDDQPLTKLASKIPKKESVDLLELLDNSQITVKRKSTLKLKETPKKIMKKKEVAPKASASKSVPAKQADKKKEMATGTGVTTRGNASLLLRHTTACPFRLPGSFMTCLVCLATFREPEEFRKHMKHEYPKLRRSLSCISSGYDIKADITELNCRICSKEFDTLEDIAAHLISVHSIGIDLKQKFGLQAFKIYKNNYSCIVCGEKCSDIRALSRHSQAHNINYTCETCGKAYGNEASVKVHARYSHGKYKTYCVKCRKGFDSSEEKKTHMLGSQKCWPYVCNYCGIRCITKTTKTSHMIAEHDHKPPLYNCPECPEIFTHKAMQIRHFNSSHTDKFQCPNCEKKFSSKKELNDHVVSHTAEKLYQCEVCFKAFTRLKTLKAHMWNHMEKKRFECKQCNKQFNQRVSWKTHMSSYHPNQTLL